MFVRFYRAMNHLILIECVCVIWRFKQKENVECTALRKYDNVKIDVAVVDGNERKEKLIAPTQSRHNTTKIQCVLLNYAVA